jgi:glutaredoxin-like YruB-family protein
MNSEHQIKVFTTPVCPYCHTLKTFLEDNGFGYEEIDVSQDEEGKKEMIEKSGQMGVPVIEIDGEAVVGFEREKIIKLLGMEEE